jgi:site-specific recombinase XerD
MSDNNLKDKEAILAENRQLLGDFRTWLEGKKGNEKTADTTIASVDLFINSFLLRDDLVEAKDGIWDISEYLGDYIIRNTTWASKAAITENIAAFKKFYTFLYERDMVSDDDIEEMKDMFKEEKADWIDAVERYKSGE